MALYQITSPQLPLLKPIYAVGITCARLVKKANRDSTIKEIPDPPGPPGCVSVKVRGFTLDFMPSMAWMVIDRLQKAKELDGFFQISTDAGELCVTPHMRDQLIKGVNDYVKI